MAQENYYDWCVDDQCQAYQWKPVIQGIDVVEDPMSVKQHIAVVPQPRATWTAACAPAKS